MGRIEVRNDVFGGALVEIERALERHAAVRLLDLNEQRVSSAHHVLDDPGGADAFGRIVPVERQLCIASADIEDGESAAHPIPPGSAFQGFLDGAVARRDVFQWFAPFSGSGPARS